MPDGSPAGRIQSDDTRYADAELRRFFLPQAARHRKSAVERRVGRSVGGALQRLTVFIGLDATLTFSEKLDRLPLFTVKSIRLWDFGFQFAYTPAPNVIIAHSDSSPEECPLTLDFNKGARVISAFLSPRQVERNDGRGRQASRSQGHQFRASRIRRYWYQASLWVLDGARLGLSREACGRGERHADSSRARLGRWQQSRVGSGHPVSGEIERGKLDIGIQQFIRLQAEEELNRQKCDASTRHRNRSGSPSPSRPSTPGL